MQQYALAMVFAYPLGVPILMWLLLWRRRQDISTRESRSGDESLDALSFLFRLYSPGKWYA